MRRLPGARPRQVRQDADVRGQRVVPRVGEGQKVPGIPQRGDNLSTCRRTRKSSTPQRYSGGDQARARRQDLRDARRDGGVRARDVLRGGTEARQAVRLLDVPDAAPHPPPSLPAPRLPRRFSAAMPAVPRPAAPQKARSAPRAAVRPAATAHKTGICRARRPRIVEYSIS